LTQKEIRTYYSEYPFKVIFLTALLVRIIAAIFSKGYGFLDVENRIPVDPETTLFRPGSISKLFTWVAVMQQVEQGKLDLDADVNKYL
jgi:CubicO group peptidase (beta-lactamase class C family)